MARARSIKPGFYKNEKLCELPPYARLLFSGLWMLADRAGRLEDRPKRIKAEVFPYDNSLDIDQLLQMLASADFIRRYSVGGNRYISIPTWDRHQNPHVREAASTIPEPPADNLGDVEHSANPVLSTVLSQPADTIRVAAAPVEHSAEPGFSGTSPADSLFSDSLTPDSGKLTPSPPSTVLARGKVVREMSEFDLAILRTVRNLHNRHPAVRSCGPKEIEKQLRLICNKFPASQRVSMLVDIDGNHTAWCDSDDWRKEGGQWCKALNNWLAPSMDRWNTRPQVIPAQVYQEPRMSAGQRAQEEMKQSLLSKRGILPS